MQIWTEKKEPLYERLREKKNKSLRRAFPFSVLGKYLGISSAPFLQLGTTRQLPADPALWAEARPPRGPPPHGRQGQGCPPDPWPWRRASFPPSAPSKAPSRTHRSHRRGPLGRSRAPVAVPGARGELPGGEPGRAGEPPRRGGSWRQPPPRGLRRSPPRAPLRCPGSAPLRGTHLRRRARLPDAPHLLPRPGRRGLRLRLGPGRCDRLGQRRAAVAGPGHSLRGPATPGADMRSPPRAPFHAFNNLAAVSSAAEPGLRGEK